MLAVVLIHVPPPAPAAHWLRPLAELGVPYFFVVSGYFLGVSRSAGGPTPSGLPAVRGMLRKVLGLYLLGCVVYALVPLDWLSPLRHGELLAACGATLSESAAAFRAAPVARLLDGPPGGFHLWFLPALACGAGLLGLAVRLRQERALLALAVALFVLGLLGGRYADTPLGLALGVNTRNGPFQSTLLVGLGYALAARGLPLRAPLRGPLVLGFGLVLLWLESAWLRAQLGVLPDAYSAAVLPLGLGAFLCFHDLPRMPARVGVRLLGARRQHARGVPLARAAAGAGGFGAGRARAVPARWRAACVGLRGAVRGERRAGAGGAALGGRLDLSSA
jgi:hypothetical protein